MAISFTQISNATSGLKSVLAYGTNTTPGTTDMTVAIQAAIDAGPAYLPPGTYKVTAPLVLLGGQSLVGAGASSILAASSVTGAVIAIGDAGGDTKIKVSGLRITGTATRAIDINNVQTFIVSDILIGGSYGGFVGTDGLRAELCWEGEISGISTSGSDISNCHFLFGEAFNQVHCANLYTGGQAQSSTNTAFKIDSSDNSGTQTSTGSSFTNLTAQGTGYGLWARTCMGSNISGLYVEAVLYPIVFGDYAASKVATNVTVNGATIHAITSSHPGYASRSAVVNFDEAIGCAVNNINLNACSSLYDVAPLTFSGGTEVTPALAVARLTAAGVIHSVEVLYGGNYSVDPTACNAANIAGETLTPVMSGTAVASVTVVGGGTGGTMTNLYPVAFTYRYAIRCVVRSPAFYAGTTFAGHAWLSPVYPLLVRTASGFGYSGVSIEKDYSFKQAGANYAGQDAEIKKVYASNTHAVIEYTAAGALYSTVFTPPVYP